MTPNLGTLFNDAKILTDTLLSPVLENPNIPSPLREAMASSVKYGGKRLRPLLTLAFADHLNVRRDQAVRVGAAIELVHCYSLIHDDLPAMDNADTRRGHPSCWREFGEATAILAGDSLLPLAFELLSDEATHPSPSVRLELIQGLAKDSGATGMAGGQMLDLSPDLIDSVEMATTMQNLKTGCLIAFSCEAAAILGERDDETRSRIRQFGFLLGLAYQIRDDLLDVEGATEDLGKPTGMDAAKRSIVALMGVEESKRYLQDLQQEMRGLIQDPLFEDIITWAATRKA